jgi:hypothetical protein
MVGVGGGVGVASGGGFLCPDVLFFFFFRRVPSTPFFFFFHLAVTKETGTPTPMKTVPVVVLVCAKGIMSR